MVEQQQKMSGNLVHFEELTNLEKRFSAIAMGALPRVLNDQNIVHSLKYRVMGYFGFKLYLL